MKRAFFFAGCFALLLAGFSFRAFIPVSKAEHLANAKKFFNAIYKKYPDDYFRIPDSSGVSWSESYQTGGKYHMQVAFMKLDTLQKGEAGYLIEETDSVIARWFPGFHIYTGRHWAHYELSTSGLPFTGFLYKDSADFFTTMGGVTHPVVKSVLASTVIPGKSNKERLGISLLNALRPGLEINAAEYKKESVTANWADENTLEVTGAWRKIVPDQKGYQPNVQGHILNISFKDDRITGFNILK